MTNFNLSLAVLVLGVFASQSLQAEAQCVASTADLPANSNCASCTAASCVWCGANAVLDGITVFPLSLPIGICRPTDCTGVGTSEPWAPNFNSLFGDYSYDGKVVHSTAVQYTSVLSASCPSASTGHVALVATQTSDCLNCQAANGGHCKISLGSDASPVARTSTLCLSNLNVCTALAVDSPQIWLETEAATAGCTGVDDASDMNTINSCRSFDTCATCKADNTCKWCQPSVMNSATPPAAVGTLLNNFGKCKRTTAACDGMGTYDGLSPLANAQFVTDTALTTTFAVDGAITMGAACTALAAVDRAALADFTTCAACTAVTGFVWCQMGLMNGDVPATTQGGVCANDAATCTGYAVANPAGYGLRAAVVNCPTPTPPTAPTNSTTTTTITTTSAAAPKAVGGAAILSVVATIWM